MEDLKLLQPHERRYMENNRIQPYWIGRWRFVNGQLDYQRKTPIGKEPEKREFFLREPDETTITEYKWQWK